LSGTIQILCLIKVEELQLISVQYFIGPVYLDKVEKSGTFATITIIWTKNFFVPVHYKLKKMG